MANGSGGFFTFPSYINMRNVVGAPTNYSVSDMSLPSPGSTIISRTGRIVNPFGASATPETYGLMPGTTPIGDYRNGMLIGGGGEQFGPPIQPFQGQYDPVPFANETQNWRPSFVTGEPWQSGEIQQANLPTPSMSTQWDIYSNPTLGGGSGFGGGGTIYTPPPETGTSIPQPGVTMPEGGETAFPTAPEDATGFGPFGLPTDIAPLISGIGSLFGGGTSNQGDTSGFFKWVSDWALRGAVIILGFVFVIAGLFLLNNLNITNIIPAGKALKAMK